MDRRKRSYRAGLLILSLLLLPAVSGDAGLRADEGENSGGPSDRDNASFLELKVELSSSTPMENNPWSIFILINHPTPSEVNVKPPRFPAILVLERVRTDTRLIRTESPPSTSPSTPETVAPAPQSERWTRVEFLFTPQRTGTVTLGPFEVTVPGRQGKTGETSVRFRENTRAVRRYEPRFRWIGTAPSVPIGKQAELVLELTSWDPDKNLPQGIFRGRAPLNALLEEIAPITTGEGIHRYTVAIIPLEGSAIRLEPFTFQAEGFTLNVPGLTVTVLPAPAEIPREADTGRSLTQGILPDEGNDSDLIEDEEGSEDYISMHPFPESREKVFPLLQGEYDRIIAGVGELWDEGRRAEALAEIRRNERDRLSGPFLIPLRKEMEQALNLGFTEDERWRPFKFPLLSLVILCIVVFSAAVIIIVFRPKTANRRKNVTFRRHSGFRTVIIFVLSLGLALIFLEGGLASFSLGRRGSLHNTAILRRCSAYRVPDFKGAVNARFGEGQPVIVGDYSGEWRYAESSDGRSGWVPREAVITY